MKNVLLFLGGSKDAMELRVKTLQKRKGELLLMNGEIVEIFAGFEGEIETMKGTEDRGLDALSYDTVSNFRSRIDTLMAADSILVSTGYYHWKTIKEIIIPENFPTLETKLTWIPSEEKEGFMGIVRYCAYKVFRSTLMEKLAIVTRWQKFINQYSYPLLKKANG